MVVELNKKQVCQFLGCKLVMMSFYGGMTDYQAFLRGGEILERQLEGRSERGKALTQNHSNRVTHLKSEHDSD